MKRREKKLATSINSYHYFYSLVLVCLLGPFLFNPRGPDTQKGREKRKERQGGEMMTCGEEADTEEAES